MADSAATTHPSQQQQQSSSGPPSASIAMASMSSMQASAHARTLTSLLSPVPSEDGPEESTSSSSSSEDRRQLPQHQLNRQDMKDFDPFATLSPPPPAQVVPPPHSQDPADRGAASASAISVGHDHTVSCVSSYSSSALSSGSFTAISVSPAPVDAHRNNLSHGGPNGLGLGPSIAIDLAASPAALAAFAASSATPLSASVPGYAQAMTRLSITPNAAPKGDETAQHAEGDQTAASQYDDPTPSTVRLHEAENSPLSIAHDYPPPATTNQQRVAVQSVLSPSFPLAPLGGYSPRPSDESPLPPVVTALMAAQKACGASPGATLSVPVESQPGRLLYVVGDQSGAGKSSVAMGLLHLLLKRGYAPQDLAYIKPATQCEDVGIISKYCEDKGIAHQGIGPVIFYEGFTAEVIDGKAESVDKRRARITKAVTKISEGKKWVIVDGVGYAAVGSVAGVSNAEVASLLNAPVLVVGRPGLGNAIDSMNFILAYFDKYHVRALGACWNKLPAVSTYHTYETCREYVNKYFRNIRPGVISTYGHIPLVELKAPAPVEGATTAAPAPAVSCRLRAAKTDLVMSDAERVFVAEFLALMEREFDIELLLSDLSRYYTVKTKLVSVV